MPLPQRFERDVKNVVEERMNLDPGSIEARLEGVENGLAGKANVNHTHSMSQVTGLTNALNDKADQTDLTALSGVVAGKANVNHTHSMSQVTGLADALNGKASQTDLTALSGVVAGKADTSAVNAALNDKANLVSGAVQLPSHGVSALPPASPAGRVIFVPDETGGATLAFSDGTDWRRVYDNAVVA